MCAWLCGALFRRFYHHKVLLMLAAVLLSGSVLLLNFTVDTVKTIALGLGAVVGLWLEQRAVQFRPAKSVFARVLRLVIGFALLMGIRLGLKPLLPDLMWCHALRYALMGFTGTFLWPWFFTRAGL